MSGAHITVEEEEDGIVVITLDRPEALNAISLSMAEELSGILDATAGASRVRCLVLTGAGDRAFSAGFDIHEMASFAPAEMREAFTARDPLTLQIALHPLPVIAALNGLAQGAGAMIAAACDFRVGCPTATFKVTAIGYGSANATWSLSRLVGPARAKDILMTGREVAADEAMAIGLFDRLSNDSAVLPTALALARDISRHPKAGTANVKRLVDFALTLSVDEGWRMEHETMLAGFAQTASSGSDVFASFLDTHNSH